MKTVSVTERAWAAGFFDGEGCTCCSLHNIRGRWIQCMIRMMISQKHPKVLRRLQAVIGGKMSLNAMYRLEVYGHERVQQAVIMMWPFLGVIKREQAIEALSRFRSHKKRNYEKAS